MRLYYICFLLLVGPFFILDLTAQQAKYDASANYAEILNINKVVVQFHPGITKSQQQTILKQTTGITNQLLFLPAPEVVVANTACTSTNSYFDLLHTLESLNEVKYIGMYIHNGQGSNAGILNKIFVKLKTQADLPLLEQLLENKGISSITPYKYNDQIISIQTNKNTTTNTLQLAIELHNSGKFEFAEPNYLVNPDVHTTDPLYYKQWALENDGSADQWNGTPNADLSVPEAWTITAGDPNILIAVMDSGVDTTHPEFINQLIQGFDAVGLGTNGFPTPNFSSDGHGTACAGIIGALADNGHGIAGVAHGCKLVSTRIFYYVDTTFSGINLGVIPFSTSEILSDGINWAWQVAQADVQSHSWSLPDVYLTLGFPSGNPALVDDALNNSFTQGRGGLGSLHFFSSGNDGPPPYWPGRDAHSMSVNATSMCDEQKTPMSCDTLDWTGNFGGTLDFSAPGVRITTVDMRDTLGYSETDYIMSFGGTSASCPFAASIGGLVLSANPNLTATEVKVLLSKTCDKVGGYHYGTWSGYGTWSEELGHGRLNAFRAVEAAQMLTNTEVVASDDEFQCYPNPVSDLLYLNAPGSGTKHLSVYTASGKLILERQFVDTYYEIDTHLLNPGFYLLQLRAGEIHHSKKIFVER